MKLIPYFISTVALNLASSIAGDKISALVKDKSLATRIPTYFVLGGALLVVSNLFVDKFEPKELKDLKSKLTL